MNHRFDQQWRKLTALARQARDEDTTVPYGFATRVAARAAAGPMAGLRDKFERFALRGLMVAATFGVVAIAFNYSAFATEQPEAYSAADTVSDMLALS